MQHRIDVALPSTAVDEDALERIASFTNNASIAITWFGWAASTADGHVTKEDVISTYSGAIQMYWDYLLKDFTEHHQLLIEAICELDAHPDATVYTGDVHDRYKELCDATRISARTRRRISDLLTDLETLGIINAVYHEGGETGITREITANA